MLSDRDRRCYSIDQFPQVVYIDKPSTVLNLENVIIGPEVSTLSHK